MFLLIFFSYSFASYHPHHPNKIFSIPIHSDALSLFFFILDSCTYILWFSIRITIIIVPWCCLFDKIKKFVELNFYTQILEEWKIHAEGKVFGLKSGVILLFLFALYVDHKLIKDTWILNFVMDFYWHMDVVYAD